VSGKHITQKVLSLEFMGFNEFIELGELNQATTALS
jgi:hypothetical protein